MPFTSVGHCEDGVLGDAQAQGKLPELLQQVFPKLWLPPYKWGAEKTPRTSWPGLAGPEVMLPSDFHLGEV